MTRVLRTRNVRSLVYERRAIYWWIWSWWIKAKLIENNGHITCVENMGKPGKICMNQCFDEFHANQESRESSLMKRQLDFIKNQQNGPEMKIQQYIIVCWKRIASTRWRRTQITSNMIVLVSLAALHLLHQKENKLWQKLHIWDVFFHSDSIKALTI